VERGPVLSMGFHLKLPNVKFLQIEGSNWHDTLHSHEDVYQISIPLEGELIARVDNWEKEINSGKAVLANPNSMHGHQLGRQKSSFIIVGFSRKALNQWAEEHLSLQDEIQFNNHQTIFASDLKQHMKEWLSPFLFHTEEDSSLTAEMESTIFHYFTTILTGSHKIKENQTSPRLLSDIYINQAIEYIHAHYRENIQIDTLATLAQQSKHHFIRSFKQWTRFSPYQYILLLRVEEAKDELRYSNKTITQTSYDLGFSSPSQFYRVFHQQVRCSPQQYRKAQIP
jgi:AraC family transcriptional regulator